MKAQLNFDLEDIDDRMAHLRCTKATEMAIALFEIIYNTRGGVEADIAIAKENKTNLNEYDIVDMLFYKIEAILEEQNINIDELVR